MTLRGHKGPTSKTCTHRKYQLTCEDYDALVAHHHGRCGVCGIAADTAPMGLFIDHESVVGDWAVRGLLCNRCNSSLHHMSSPEAAAYLASPWYLTALPAKGLRLKAESEPPDGAVVHLPAQNLTWERTGRHWHCTNNARRRNPLSWRELNRRYGPFNIRVLST
ncbi:endonuclease domain-containing protein [Herbidospora daliensis]|uniref:endonuclease domain-containing protein n=1 Tax=Herbidospora daliensis TaxID=295585 RepID=UPI0007804CEC|nr:endonuclease domain-containing protein [Herbidospora daliensis]